LPLTTPTEANITSINFITNIITVAKINNILLLMIAYALKEI